MRRKTTSHCKCVQRYFQQKTPIASNCDSIGQLEIIHLKYLPTNYTCISLNIITFHLNVDVTKLKISSDVSSILAKVQNVNRFFSLLVTVLCYLFRFFPVFKMPIPFLFQNINKHDTKQCIFFLKKKLVCHIHRQTD